MLCGLAAHLRRRLAGEGHDGQSLMSGGVGEELDDDQRGEIVLEGRQRPVTPPLTLGRTASPVRWRQSNASEAILAVLAHGVGQRPAMAPYGPEGGHRLAVG